MKRFVLFASTILILILITTAQPYKAAPIITGDLNSDGQVNSDDAIFLLMHSQFPDDPNYKLNQELKFQKGAKVSSDDAIYLLMHTQFPSDYPIDGSVKIMKMKYKEMNVYSAADADSDIKGTIIYNTTYTVTKTTTSGAWSYLREMSGWVPSKALVEKSMVLPETYTYAREYIAIGYIGDTVKEVQAALNDLGYTDKDGKKLTVDGIFGGATDYAVKAFQEDYDLGADGCLSPTGITWGKIDSIDRNGYGVTFVEATDVYAGHTKKTGGISKDSEGLAVHTIPSGWTYIKDIDGWVYDDTYVDRVSLQPYRNDEYSKHTVNTVKALLNRHGFKGESGSALLINGTYDDGLYYALCNFQSEVGLYPIGDMGYNGVTWQKLNSYQKVSVSYPHLYQGMSTTYKSEMMPYISMLNRFLNQIGYSAEKTNIAYWTSATLSAVKDFQEDYDLGADGYVGNGTWNTLIKQVIMNDTTSDKAFESYLDEQGFPESYKVYLRRLHAEHPNWIFVAEEASKDWNTFASYQFKHDTSQPTALMNKGWADCLKCKDSITYSGGTYKTYDGGSWVVPSEETIAYYMDPRNFLDETNVFEFYDLAYDDIYTESFVSSVASYLGMNYMTGTYTHSDGTTINYPKVIAALCEKYDYNPIAFISSVKQEIGTSPEADMICGTYSGYEGYYNYVNYGAYQDGSMSPKERGMWAAKNRGWSTREKAIEGAIALYADNYIKAGQETIYYKKFNAKASTSFASHQFMSNIAGAYSEGFSMGYALLDKLSDAAITFRIPVYSGMKEANYLLPNY